MNKILVEVSVGELLDKISILEIKKEKIKDSDKLEYINNEHKMVHQEPQYPYDSQKISSWLLIGF